MPITKNDGEVLTSEFLGEIDLFPPEFRAAIGIRKTEQQVARGGTNDELDDLAEDVLADGALVSNQLVQTRTNERLKTKFSLIGDIDTELEDEIFIRETCQIGHRTRRLVPEGTHLSHDCTTWAAEQHNLGNGFVDQIVTVVDEPFTQPTERRERPVVTPEDFRAELQEDETSLLICGTKDDIDPFIDGDGKVMQSREQVDDCKYRETTRIIDQLDLPKTIVNKRTNQLKQVETVTRILEDDSSTPATPSSLRDVNFTKLGDGTALEERIDILSVFPQDQYIKSRPVVTPEEFRALLKESTHSFIEEGVAEDPTLSTGDIEKRSEQVNVFDRRQTTKSIDSLSLPKTNTHKETNQFKQVVTVDRILELDSTSPALPTSLRDVSFHKLGDGTAVEERKTVSEVFPQLVTSATIEDAIPEIFKAAFPMFVEEETLEGTPDVEPSLPAGALEIVETAVDAFNMRQRVRSRGDIGHQTKIAARRFGGEPFGGEITQIEADIDDTEQSVDEGYEIVSSEVKDLGNGQFVRQTEKLDEATEWPELEGQEYDDSLDVAVPYIEKTIEQGTEIGTGKTDIKPLDKHHAKKKTIDSTAAETVLGAYLMAYPSKIDISMPDKLVSLESQIQSQTGDGADSETGEVAGYGNYSINLDLRADATASATIIPEVFAEIKQFYGSNIDCTHYIFFLPNPVTTSDVITKLNAILSPDTVSTWPKFNPQTLTMLIIGANSALKVNAVSKGSYSQSADLTSQSSTAGGGTGYSRARGMTLRRMQISPTIHGPLSVSGTTTDSADLNAACDSEAVGLGPAKSVDITDTINASVTPTSFSATDGDTDWPTSGLYLYRVDAKPYRYGFVMFHAIVVDAADFPSS